MYIHVRVSRHDFLSPESADLTGISGAFPNFFAVLDIRINQKKKDLGKKSKTVSDLESLHLKFKL